MVRSLDDQYGKHAYLNYSIFSGCKGTPQYVYAVPWQLVPPSRVSNLKFLITSENDENSKHPSSPLVCFHK